MKDPTPTTRRDLRREMGPPGRLLATVLSLGLAGCPGNTSGPRPADGRPLLTEVTGAVGLEKAPGPWPDGTYRIPEISAAGIALFDFDGDGDLDIYQVLHPEPARADTPAPNRLHEQRDDGTFSRVEGASGLDDGGYGNGVAIGDVDGDGHPDVYVSNLGEDALYLNEGNGTFREGTDRAGIRGDHWSTCAAFFDPDRDGDLDLFVSHYLLDDPTRVCRPGVRARRDYCGPSRYQGVPDTFYRNNGDGTFADVSRSAGITGARPGFGVICVDLTGDGWVDIYVANDMQPNQLHVNQRGESFVDQAMARGVALSGLGKVEASMGVTVGDVNGDGNLDLFMTHLVDQTNTLYLAGGIGEFFDRSASSGLGGPSLPLTGWGCGFVDFDHDGDLDLALVNGRVARGETQPGAAAGIFWNDYAEPNQLFLNDGAGHFGDASDRGGRFTSRLEVSRALAFGDLDRDGDVDMVLSDIGDGLRVIRNDAPAAGNHWLRLRALTGNRDALGALVKVEAGGVRQVRPLITAYSFSSASEAVAHFGLGGARKVDTIEVMWPDGVIERFTPPPVDRLLTVRQGEGETVPAAEGEPREVRG